MDITNNGGTDRLVKGTPESSEGQNFSEGGFCQNFG